jgi:molybdopterin molybdotransferase
MLNVMSAGEVVQIIEEHFEGYRLEEEAVMIGEAVGRTVAADMVSPEEIPSFNRSSVDGYAVIASSTFGASESLPAQLKLIGEVRMGEKPQFSLEAGQAAYVPTGGELPPGADAMVMIEYTENLDDGFIYIEKPAAPGNHVVFAGDDVRKESTVMRAGTVLRPQDIGLLAAVGIPEIAVRRKLRVGILSTGDEIVDIRKAPTGAQVRDINAHCLYAGLVVFGAEPKHYGIVKDNYNEIRHAVEAALAQSDIVLISGGSSAGLRDETSRVIDSLGKPGVLVHGIAVKPGKPTILGEIGGKAVVGLPGHPASAYMIFNVFIRHLVRIMSGSREGFRTALTADMAYNYPSNNGREEFLPVKLEEVNEKLYVSPVFGKSGQITLLTAADGYVHISRGSEGIDKGRQVTVHLF